MAAPTNAANVKKVLANSEPSTHGGKADIAERHCYFRFMPCVDGSELARDIFTFAELVGAAMCSACLCGSYDRWP